MRLQVTAVAVGLLVVLSAIYPVIHVYLYQAVKLNPDLADVPYNDIVVTSLVVQPKTMLYAPWTVATSSFVEPNIKAAGSAALLFIACRYFERIWGSRSLAKFLALVSVGSVLITIAVSLLLCAVTLDSSYASRPIYGPTPIYIGFAVAFKQAIPLHTVNLFKGLFKVQIKYFVLPLLVTFTILGLVLDYTYLVLAWSSLGLSWWYLRFIKSIIADSLLSEGESTLLKGDKSDAFAFAKFFYPIRVTTAVASVCNKIYDLAVSTKLIRSYNEEQVAASNQRVQGTTDADAERRRALGIQVLGS